MMVFSTYKFPGDSTEQVGFVPLVEEYATEIITVLKFEKDPSYFIYAKLFEYQVKLSGTIWLNHP